MTNYEKYKDTEKGEMLLVTLDAWHEKNMKTEAD